MKTLFKTTFTSFMLVTFASVASANLGRAPTNPADTNLDRHQDEFSSLGFKCHIVPPIGKLYCGDEDFVMDALISILTRQYMENIPMPGEPSFHYIFDQKKNRLPKHSR